MVTTQLNSDRPSAEKGVALQFTVQNRPLWPHPDTLNAIDNCHSTSI